MVCTLLLNEVLPLRALVLRNGNVPEALCMNEGDDFPETFHLGWKTNENVLGIASFMPEDLPGQKGKGYRLRGMAVHPEAQGKGMGTQILISGINRLKKMKINYLWCNARKIAYSFYSKEGFIFVSEEFDIPGIGSHKVMCLHWVDF